MGSKRKAKARALLEKRDLDGIESWTRESKSALSTLFSLTFEKDELLRWRAIEAIGKAAAVVATQNEERVKDFLRRLLWLMNDESGGLGWHAPEAIGEVVFNIPKLAGEYAIILTSFLREEPFERGAHFSTVRVGPFSPDAILASAPVLTASLQEKDPAIRAFAYHALRIGGSEIASESLRILEKDTDAFNIYDFEQGDMHAVTVKKYLREVK
jgi:HEAT repeat protein